jgi:hypothetical protein
MNGVITTGVPEILEIHPEAIDRIRRENRRDGKQKEAQMVYDDDPTEPLVALAARIGEPPPEGGRGRLACRGPRRRRGGSGIVV